MTHQLPEPHIAVEVSKDNWVWPNCEFFDIYDSDMFCTDVFRATGTTFIRVVDKKFLVDYEARRYVPGIYMTAAEWSEMI